MYAVIQLVELLPTHPATNRLFSQALASWQDVATGAPDAGAGQLPETGGGASAGVEGAGGEAAAAGAAGSWVTVGPDGLASAGGGQAAASAGSSAAVGAGQAEQPGLPLAGLQQGSRLVGTIVG